MPAPSNTLIKLAAIGALLMAAVIVYCLLYGNFSKEGAALTHTPWGIAALVDLYLGLIIFCFWIFWREQSKTTALCWTALLMLTGNLGACVYIIYAVLQANGSGSIFWCGNNEAVPS